MCKGLGLQKIMLVQYKTRWWGVGGPEEYNTGDLEGNKISWMAAGESKHGKVMGAL